MKVQAGFDEHCLFILGTPRKKDPATQAPLITGTKAITEGEDTYGPGSVYSFWTS